VNPPVTIATTSVAGEWLEPDVSEHMGLQAVRAAAIMVAPSPSALEHGKGRHVPGRRQGVVGKTVGEPYDISELLDIAGAGSGQLVRLVGDRAAKYFAPLSGGG